MKRLTCIKEDFVTQSRFTSIRVFPCWAAFFIRETSAIGIFNLKVFRFDNLSQFLKQVSQLVPPSWSTSNLCRLFHNSNHNSKLEYLSMLPYTEAREIKWNCSEIELLFFFLKRCPWMMKDKNGKSDQKTYRFKNKEKEMMKILLSIWYLGISRSHHEMLN